MHLQIDDTIVAQSSAPGPGARAIVRLSGRDAVALAGKVFLTGGLVDGQRRGITSGFLHLNDVAAPIPAELYVFPAPRSYTAQTVVEVHMLSSPPLVEQLVADLLACGARAAQPGEFTLRAFLAGKIDLPKAEAALATIEAGTRDELKAALKQLAGGVSRPLDGLRDDLLNLLADLEAGLDFVDEDIEFVGRPATLKRLAEAMARVRLVQKQVFERGLTGPVFRVAIVGRPNAGKSRLFNAITGAAALVSNVAGTTRDYLVARVQIDDMPIDVIDTAGVREVADEIENTAQRLGQAAIGTVDLVLLCCDAAGGADMDAPPVDKVWHVATKCDLAPAPAGTIPTSAATGLGIRGLLFKIGEAVKQHAYRGLAPSLSRCRKHVDACLESLRRTHEGVLFDAPPEAVAAELRIALDELGGLTGAVHTDDLLDRVFSRFCIGK